MFEFITISNGVAVVQHVASGSVYRFRPINPGLWDALTPHGVDTSAPTDLLSDDLADEARVFAEAFASLMFTAPPELSRPEHPARNAARWSFRLSPRRILA